MPAVTRMLPIVLCTLLVCVCSRLPTLALGPVPVTLQSFAVILAGALLGPWRGGLAVALYLLLGMAGLPVFSGGAAGAAVFAGPSAGYLFAFPLVAMLCGALVQRLPATTRWPRPLLVFACGLGSSALLVHPLGITGLMLALDIDAARALAIDMTFWPGDVIKNTLMAAVVCALHRRWPWLLGARRTAAGAQPA